jgi:hypothetical protein
VSVFRLILDTNMLVLNTVGMASRYYIRQHKKLSVYNIADHELLIRI